MPRSLPPHPLKAPRHCVSGFGASRTSCKWTDTEFVSPSLLSFTQRNVCPQGSPMLQRGAGCLSFLRLNGALSYVWVIVCFSSACWWALGLLYLLTISSSVAMDMGIETSELLLSILLDRQEFLKSSRDMKIIKPAMRPQRKCCESRGLVIRV